MGASTLEFSEPDRRHQRHLARRRTRSGLDPKPRPPKRLGVRRATLAIIVALGSLAATGGTASAAAQQPSPSGPQSYRIVIKLSGNQYEDAQNNLVNDPRATKCSPSQGVSVTAGCWTWTATHLGHGTYAIAQPRLEAAHLTWVFTYTNSNGETLTGNLVEGFIEDPSTLDATTHANRYPETYTFTGGTGRFAGVTGIMTGTTTTSTVTVDPATGIAHVQFTGQSIGTLTFRSKL
jgi:hypothetical protein